MSISFGHLAKAYSTWESVKQISLGAVDHQALGEFAKLFEYDLPPEQSNAVVALLANEDPTIMFGDFIQSGGLFRLITGRNSNESAPQLANLVRCPHCEELHLA